MNVTHELKVTKRCPVNGAEDIYDVTIETDALVNVERIMEIVDALPETIFQEHLTERLATELASEAAAYHHFRVQTVGFHSGIKTTCVASYGMSQPQGYPL